MAEGVNLSDSRGEVLNMTFEKHCGCSKLTSYDWMKDIPNPDDYRDIIEVRFKNTRKGFYRNSHNIRFKPGNVIAVEASPGHDIGVVSLCGELVLRQMKKNGVQPDSEELKKAYRKAKPVDIDKWKEAIEQEHLTMIRSRQIAEDLNLNMKIGDVEYQGDKTKAIFYYIADERVDFRELIKVLADTFKVRIEMRQIGARQEAGRIGGIGSCGRELCCSSWISNFVSVTTNAARFQEVSLNPQKLAGQCGKLKCCLNYELNTYLDAQKDFPERNVVLEVVDGQAYHQKTDVFRGLYWYAFEKDHATSLVPIPVERVKEIIALNKQGKKVNSLIEFEEQQSNVVDFQDDVGKDSITRFDNKRSKSKNKRKNKRRNSKPNKS